jgi:hypothetical protein
MCTRGGRDRPGTWQDKYDKPVPEVCPAPTRDHLASPLGLLFNELQKCHEHIINCLEEMLSHVMELDTGKFSAHTSHTVLYVVRLIVKVEAYLLYIIRHARWRKKWVTASARATPAVHCSSHPLLNQFAGRPN